MKYLILILLTYSFNSHAWFRKSASTIVARQVEKKLQLAQDAFSKGEHLPTILHGENLEAYYLKRIRLQYAPFVAFDIAFFEVKIVPIIEFRWSRRNPTGWSNYSREI